MNSSKVYGLPSAGAVPKALKWVSRKVGNEGWGVASSAAYSTGTPPQAVPTYDGREKEAEVARLLEVEPVAGLSGFSKVHAAGEKRWDSSQGVKVSARVRAS
jgi:hypothetical protein